MLRSWVSSYKYAITKLGNQADSKIQTFQLKVYICSTITTQYDFALILQNNKMLNDFKQNYRMEREPTHYLSGQYLRLESFIYLLDIWVSTQNPKSLS